MLRRLAAAALLAVTAAGAQAQSLPDFTGMDVTALNNTMWAGTAAQMEQTTNAIVVQVMQSPDFQARYMAFLQQGGQATPQQYAYEYARQGGFTAEGRRRARESDLADQRKIAGAVQGLRQAEGESAAAIQGMWDAGARRSEAVGDLMSGVAPMVDPASGQSVKVPYVGPLVTTDPATGQTFVRDPQTGAVYVQTPYGLQLMTPAP